ncbi:MAG: VanW family protein [Leptospiraceae bacterium]|nr:VanW family protein [Leptospiraceae bacterium]
MRWQNLLPGTLRREVRILQRKLRDVRNGDYKKFAHRSSMHPALQPWQHFRLDCADFPERSSEQYADFDAIGMRQPIRASETVTAKLRNLRIAVENINTVPLAPGAIFSFWYIVGRPLARRGFQKSRMLVRGQLEHAIGGGLCQLSGLLYHLGLIGGLDILERHAHTRDIYTEAERFTPLGADAAVVYGVKDLRMQNPYDFPVQFQARVHPDALTACLHAAGRLSFRQLHFERRRLIKNREEVFGWHVFNGSRRLISSDTYISNVHTTFARTEHAPVQLDT